MDYDALVIRQVPALNGVRVSLEIELIHFPDSPYRGCMGSSSTTGRPYPVYLLPCQLVVRVPPSYPHLRIIRHMPLFRKNRPYSARHRSHLLSTQYTRFAKRSEIDCMSLDRLANITLARENPASFGLGQLLQSCPAPL